MMEDEIENILDNIGLTPLIINRFLARDFSISAECKGLILFLLSHQYYDETFSLEQIFSLLNRQISNHRVIKMLNEAIESGYIYKKIESHDYSYIVSNIPVFKKINLLTNQEGEKR
jgi:hypothetical protein